MGNAYPINAHLSLSPTYYVLFLYEGTPWQLQTAEKLMDIIGQQRAIIYMDFVKDIAPLAIALSEKGVKCGAFHGKKLSPQDKTKLVENWMRGEIQVMVCTKAFGMGIDQPDIGVVVRIGCPPTLEDWAQEFGRAGRDGRRAKGNNYLFTTCAMCIYQGIHQTRIDSVPRKGPATC